MMHLPELDDLILDLADAVRKGERRTAFISGPYGSGKTTALAEIIRAISDKIPLVEVAAFAPTRLMFRRLAEVIAAPWPEIEQPHHDLFPPGFCGIPSDALASHSAVEGIPTGPWFEGMAAKRWTEFHHGIVETLDDEFLKGLIAPFKTALRVDRHARLTRTPLPKNVYLTGVAAFVEDLKRREGLIDRADMIHGDYVVSPQIKILALDEVSMIDRATIERFFPSASVIATGLDHHAADLELVLDQNLRAPERFEFRCSPELTPDPGEFDSLFVITPPWHQRQWRTWSTRYGIPGSMSDRRFQAIRAAWRFDQGEVDIPAHLLNPLLAKIGLEAGSGMIAQGDIEGWTDWQDMARRFNPMILAHAESVLDRWGSLDHLPIVRVGTPFGVRGIEADIVIADLPTNSKGLSDLALSRAIRKIFAIFAS